MLVKYGGGTSGHEFDIRIDVEDIPSRREALIELSRPVSGAHGLAKKVRPEVVDEVLSNEPFEDYPRAVWGYKHAFDRGVEARNNCLEAYRKTVEGFLRQTFNSLTFITEISVDFLLYSESDEQRGIGNAAERYRVANMSGQINSVKEAYNGLRALRTVFSHVSQRGNCSLPMPLSNLVI